MSAKVVLAATGRALVGLVRVKVPGAYESGARRPKVWVLVLAMPAAALLGLAAIPKPPLLVWNLTSSVPIGLYRMDTGLEGLKVGDLVLVWPPKPAADLAAARGYIPLTTPLIKRIAGRPGDRICGLGLQVWVNGQQVARRLMQDRRGRDLPHWSGCHRLGPDQWLVLGEASSSFDGRYFGPSQGGQIKGRLWPLGGPT